LNQIKEKGKEESEALKAIGATKSMIACFIL